MSFDQQNEFILMLKLEWLRQNERVIETEERNVSQMKGGLVKWRCRIINSGGGGGGYCYQLKEVCVVGAKLVPGKLVETAEPSCFEAEGCSL